MHERELDVFWKRDNQLFLRAGATRFGTKFWLWVSQNDSDRQDNQLNFQQIEGEKDCADELDVWFYLFVLLRVLLFRSN